MNPLKSKELAGVLSAVERIHAAPTSGNFVPELFAALGSLLPGAAISLETFDRRSGHSASVGARAPAKGVEEWQKRLLELLPTHPAFPHIQGTPNTVVAVTDCMTQRQFRRTAFYQDILKPVDLPFQMIVGLDIPHHVAGMAIGRDRDFTDSEREIVRILAPHLALAHVHVQTLASLEAARLLPVPDHRALVRLGFTPREAEVVQWVIEGKRDPEIAEILGVSPRSIHKHVQQILLKLGVETRTAAALEALRRHFLHHDING